MVDELVRNGVSRAVLAPGSRSAALALALAGHEGIDLRVEIDERSAAFLAVGAAKARGEPAVVVTTSGTAAANLLPAVTEADAARLPTLVLTADRPPELRQAGANQTIDQVKLFGERVRWFCELGVAEDFPGANAYWRSTVCRAVAEARGGGGPAGPVHINLPFREPTVPMADDGRSAAPPFAGELGGRPEGRPWTETAPRLLPLVELPERWRVERGLVIAGEDLAGPGAARGLAASLGWPLMAEPLSGERGEGTITTAHYLLGHAGFADRHRPEVVVRFGRAGLSRRLGSLLAGGVPQLVVAPWGWPDPERSATEVLRGVPVAEPRHPGGAWLDSWQEAEARARAALDAALDADTAPSEPRVARDVARAASGVTLVVASSMPVRDLDLVMEPLERRVVGNRGASGIDGLVSTALGVAWAEGGALALTGDLSLLHDQNGFLVEPRPRAVFVVVNNDGGALFHFLPQVDFPHFERVFATPHGRSIEALARLYDLDYRRIERGDEVEPTVAAALKSGESVLIEVPTDRRTNVEAHRRLEETVAKALG